MARKHLIAAVAVTAIGMIAAPVARAQMAVFDGTSFAEIVQQLNAMTQQVKTTMDTLNVLSSVRDIETQVQNAIGSVTHITLPITSLQSMATQLRGNLQCLIPQTPSWGIKLEDMNFGSVCDTTGKYRDALFIDTSLSAIQSGTSSVSLEQTEAALTQRREALLADTAVRSLGQSDTTLNQQVQNLASAADDLQASLTATQTVQDRLQVIGQIALLQVRATADQNQLLAQTLKLQGARAVVETRADITVPSIPATSGTTTASSGGQ